VVDSSNTLTTFLAPVLTPHGRLLLAQVEDAPPLSLDLAERLQEAFTRGHGHGLLQLGAAEVQTAMPPVFLYWRTRASSRPTVDT